MAIYAGLFHSNWLAIEIELQGSYILGFGATFFVIGTSVCSKSLDPNPMYACSY